MSCLGMPERLQSAPALVKTRCVSPLVYPLHLPSCRSHSLAYPKFCRDREFGLSAILFLGTADQLCISHFAWLARHENHSKRCKKHPPVHRFVMKDLSDTIVLVDCSGVGKIEVSPRFSGFLPKSGRTG